MISAGLAQAQDTSAAKVVYRSLLEIPLIATSGKEVDLIDKRWVEHTYFLTRKYNKPEKLPEPVIKHKQRGFSRPWKKGHVIHPDMENRGEFLTRPFKLECDRIFVNAKIEEGGSIVVELCDEAGVSMKGLELTRAEYCWSTAEDRALGISSQT